MEAARRLGDYELLRPIGAGGMGQVWEARHPGLPGKRLALKLLGDQLDPEARQRFLREAELLARVSHPGVVRVLSAGEGPSGPYLVMDLVEGESLEEVRRRGPLPPAQALSLVTALGQALTALHQAGIVHRDLKPHNVLLRPDGSPTLVDFGLAWARDVQRLTQTGTILGTPAYMPPELVEDAARVDLRADVYGLGALLYALLSGRPPFEAGSPLAILHQVLAQPVSWPPSGAPGGDVPGDLRRAVEAALAKDPGDRPPDVPSFLRSLHAQRPAGRGAPALLLLALLLALAGVGAAFAARDANEPSAAEPAPATAPGTGRPLPARLEGPSPGQPSWLPQQVLRRSGALKSRFAGSELLVWSAHELQPLTLPGSGADGAAEPWSMPLRASPGVILVHPAGGAAWSEVTPSESWLVAAREGRLAWTRHFSAQEVKGLAVWPDERTLTVAVAGVPPLRRAQLIRFDWETGEELGQSARVRVGEEGPTLGEIAGVAGRLFVVEANSYLGALNKVVPWRVADEVLEDDGRSWQVGLSPAITALCQGQGRVWLGDRDGRIYGLKASAGADPRDEELLEVHSPDGAPPREESSGPAAHPPHHSVRALRCAAGRLWSLASVEKAPAELRCWYVTTSASPLGARITGLPTNTDFDLDPAGSRLVLTLPVEGVWLVPVEALGSDAVEWNELRARARDDRR